jgi:kynurenine 3-monooxygenase
MKTQDEKKPMKPLSTELTTDVVIIGAGLVGPFVAGILAKRDLRVMVVDYRPDPELEMYPEVRKLHIGLSKRGLTALKKYGIVEALEKVSVKQYGRRIHFSETHADYFPYSLDRSNCLFTLSREDLNKEIIKYIKQFPSIQLFFGHKCHSVDLDRRRVVLTNLETNEEIAISATVIIGADGVNSCVREAIQEKTNATISVTLSQFGYKHIHISQQDNQKLGLKPEEVHIWPHGTTMLLGLAGVRGDLNCALVMPMNGNHSFASFSEREKINAFFREKYHFPEAISHELSNQFIRNPIGRLPVINCERWYYEGSAVLLGDAAQSTVPWYAQGVNKALHDCILLEQIIDEKKEWQYIFPAFQQQAKPPADALARLSECNFDELREGVTEQHFAEKKQVEVVLSKQYPQQFKSTYEMIAFSLIPFDVVENISAAQDKIILDALPVEPNIGRMHIPDVMRKIRKLYESVNISSQSFDLHSAI